MKLFVTIALLVMAINLNGKDVDKSSETTNFTILSSGYKIVETEKIEFNRIVKYLDKFYHIEGSVSFDDEGNTLQTISEKKEISEDDIKSISANMKNEDFKSTLFNDQQVVLVHFVSKDLNSLRTEISHKIKEELVKNDLWESSDISMFDGTVNLEFEVKDWNKALSLIYKFLIEEKIIEKCLIGKRVYFEEEDYNYEVVYPIDYEGSFYSY
ncbi:hypothetical protein MNBD_IGNAVI01-2922 [hydrothermal vent metagenome]|uniref:Uncharacterized protein n=1 Tax=hydrothermal vent metagenome TaxID=652676 RepID=A0A3B1D1D0_9ZZZZ